MKKWGIMISTAVVTAVLLVGCGGESKQAATDSSQSAPAAASGNTINLEASNWKFNQDKFEVKAGEPVTINFKSVEGFHGISIEGMDFDLQKEGSKTVTFDKPGEYKIFCNIPCGPDHGQMSATVVVK